MRKRLRERLFALLVGSALTGPVLAQVPVPFVSDAERFVVFSNKRFEVLEPRPPRWVHASEGQVVYQDHDGSLKLFLSDGRRLHLLQEHAPDTVLASRGRVAWANRDTVKVLRGGRPHRVAQDVERFTLSDSLLVLHDSARQELVVASRGELVPLATLERGSARPQWDHGTDRVTFHDRSTLKLHQFRAGRCEVLTDSCGLALVATGGGLTGYWNDVNDRFEVQDGSGVHRLSELRPASAKAGQGLLGFVDGNGRLRCWQNGRLFNLDEQPTAYWVQDSLLVWVKDAALKVFDGAGAVTVEPYVPERFVVRDGLLVWLDMNRELRGWHRGERMRFGTEAAIASFEVYGDAVVYPSPLGPTVVVYRGRSYES